MKKVLVLIMTVVIAGVIGAESNSDALGYELILGEFDQLRQNILDFGNKSHSKIAARSVKFEFASHEVPSCQETPANASGVYRIHPELSTISSFLVYCDHTVENGGWIVIHRRFDGNLNFNRPWVDYRQGFGNLQSEYWLGLEKMHQITRADNYELLVVLKSFNNATKTARIDRFMVASEFEKYKLNVGQLVVGEAGNSFSQHNGMMFTTIDRDNDLYKENCAIIHSSGWWFTDNYYSNLNGKHKKEGDETGMTWFKFNKSYITLKEARMLIRRM
ncbi:angiopoietin-related protein 1-like [Wyeomyia smithii]|uniref:angiopoietin-related protein 1-like n=1 Tax=Wyeomyia smithii TaxID=174621 RepID=UPI0024681EA7|nr:angiopoietin-related protein 1-like [Wyeomyia smithii]